MITQVKLNCALALSFFMLFTGALADSKLIATPLQGQPALAGWLGDFIPVPTGLYFELNGKKFYLGDYSANPTLAFSDSKWEVKVNRQIWAHGRGETPGWVVESAQKFFRF